MRGGQGHVSVIFTAIRRMSARVIADIHAAPPASAFHPRVHRLLSDQSQRGASAQGGRGRVPQSDLPRPPLRQPNHRTRNATALCPLSIDET